MKLVGTRTPGQNPAMQMGWPGVLKVLNNTEKREFEKKWDARVAAQPKPNIIINFEESAPPPLPVGLCPSGPFLTSNHRWAYLVKGGQACAWCGVKRW